MGGLEAGPGSAVSPSHNELETIYPLSQYIIRLSYVYQPSDAANVTLCTVSSASETWTRDVRYARTSFLRRNLLKCWILTMIDSSREIANQFNLIL